MPILKKQPYIPRPNPLFDNPSTLVYQLSLTGEIFSSYEDYLGALTELNKPQWTCKLTGKTGLTFEQALLSEMETSELVEAIPEELKKFAASKAQFSLAAISVIVDNIVDELKIKFLRGELVLFEEEPGRRIPARVISTPEDESKGNVYELELLDPIGHSTIGEARSIGVKLLSRPKNALSKILIKKFLRGVTYRRNAFLPWQLTDETISSLGISIEAPPEIAAMLIKDANNRMRSPSKKTGKSAKPLILESPPALPVYPMDDFLLLPEDLIDESKFPSLASCPDYFSASLEAWSFITCFSKKIKVSPISWEDWQECLEWTERKNPPLEAIYYALLTPISKFRKNSSKTQYFEWLQPISNFFVSPSATKFHEDNEIQKDESDAILNETELAEYLAKFKWSEEKDPHWSSLAAGFLADCAFLNPSDPFLGQIVSSYLGKKDPSLILAALSPDSKVTIILALIRTMMLKFIDPIKDMVDSIFSSQENLVIEKKEGLAERHRLHEQISEQEALISSLKENNEVKDARKAEAVLRGYRAAESKVEKRIEKTDRDLNKAIRVRPEPLGTDHQGRSYWLFSDSFQLGSLFVEQPDCDDNNNNARWYRLESKEQFDRLVNEYLNEKGLRENALKLKLLDLHNDLELEEYLAEATLEDSDDTKELEINIKNEQRQKRTKNLDELAAASKRARKVPSFLKYKNTL